jgi:hypothetical protein
MRLTGAGRIGLAPNGVSRQGRASGFFILNLRLKNDRGKLWESAPLRPSCRCGQAHIMDGGLPAPCLVSFHASSDGPTPLLIEVLAPGVVLLVRKPAPEWRA